MAFEREGPKWGPEHMIRDKRGRVTGHVNFRGYDATRGKGSLWRRRPQEHTCQDCGLILPTYELWEEHVSREHGFDPDDISF